MPNQKITLLIACFSNYKQIAAILSFVGIYHWKKPSLFKRNKECNIFKSRTHKTFQTKIMISNLKHFFLFRKPNDNIKIVQRCLNVITDLWQGQTGKPSNLVWFFYNYMFVLLMRCQVHQQSCHLWTNFLSFETLPHSDGSGISTLWIHS